MSNIDLSALAAEFPRAAVSWRAQNLTQSGDKALALAYIDARDVMDRLDTVCAPENWQDRYEFHGARTVCYLSIRIGAEWITKADGAGDSDVEAEKGAISDALKRAAVKWGIGRYLYAIESPWVPCESYEKNGKKYWKRWTADPWSSVRGSSRATTEHEVQPSSVEQSAPRAQTSVEQYLGQMDAASTVDKLQLVFGRAWEAHPGANSRTTLKNKYDARKTALTPIPKTLGDHLDKLERDAAANPN